MAAATEARTAGDKARRRARAAEEALAEAARARDEAVARSALFREEVRSVRASLAEAQAARRIADERAAGLEREGGEARARTEADARARELAAAWTEREASEPAPPVDIHSPVVASVLASCSPDATRRAELVAWLKAVCDDDFARIRPPRFDIERMPAEATVGLFTMVLPLLQLRRDLRLRVLTRERTEVRTDVRLLVQDNRHVVESNPNK